MSWTLFVYFFVYFVVELISDGADLTMAKAGTSLNESEPHLPHITMVKKVLFTLRNEQRNRVFYFYS